MFAGKCWNLVGAFRNISANFFGGLNSIDNQVCNELLRLSWKFEAKILKNVQDNYIHNFFFGRLLKNLHVNCWLMLDTDTLKYTLPRFSTSNGVLGLLITERIVNWSLDCVFSYHSQVNQWHCGLGSWVNDTLSSAVAGALSNMIISAGYPFWHPHPYRGGGDVDTQPISTSCCDYVPHSRIHGSTPQIYVSSIYTIIIYTYICV